MKKYPIFEHINHNRYILIFLCDILAFLRNRQINEGCFLCLFDLLLWYIMSKCWVIFALRRNNSEFLQLLQTSIAAQNRALKDPLYLVFILCRPLFILCTSCYCYITIRAQNPPIPSSIQNWSLFVCYSKEHRIIKNRFFFIFFFLPP